MIKSYLKTGDIVKLRNNNICICVGDAIICQWPKCTLIKLSQYKEDLKHIDLSSCDIMFVRLSPRLYLEDLGEILRGMPYMGWDWKRKEVEEVKEVTISEVEEKFGCKIKIVKESHNNYECDKTTMQGE